MRLSQSVFPKHLSVSLSARMFLFCLYPSHYILKVKTSSRRSAGIFSIAVPVFRNFFSESVPGPLFWLPLLVKNCDQLLDLNHTQN